MCWPVFRARLTVEAWHFVISLCVLWTRSKGEAGPWRQGRLLVVLCAVGSCRVSCHPCGVLSCWARAAPCAWDALGGLCLGCDGGAAFQAAAAVSPALHVGAEGGAYVKVARAPALQKPEPLPDYWTGAGISPMKPFA